MQSFKNFISEITTIKLSGFGANNERKKRSDAFIDELHKTSKEHPLNPKARIIGNAHVYVSGNADGIHIHDIQSHEQGSGAGTKALKHLTGLADRHNVKLHLYAKGYGSTSDHQLRKWYKKHGFHSDEDDKSDMTRHPM